MEDEYGVKQILIDNHVGEILPKINKQLDKVCGDYMMDREKCKRAAFTEIKCQLLQAIIKTEDNDQLQVEIKKIIEAI